MVMLLLTLAILPLAFSKSTIETDKLWLNTVKRWNVDIQSRSDHAERYKRFVQAQDSVERTTSGVMLESLNKMSVMNDKEFEATVAAVKRHSNITLQSLQKREPYKSRIVKRDMEMPATYTYWEETVGFAPAMNQASCGSCWAFPATATMEALYKAKTGEAVKFSEEYFMDCTFSYSGCAGGTVNDGYKLVMDTQYLMSEEMNPWTADYNPCTAEQKEDIITFKNNALKKLWITDWLPLGKNEASFIQGLMISPVAFGSYISNNIYAYSGGMYDDAKCATEALPHAMLLVGYTETILRVRNSYGPDVGDNGYINYKRDSGNLVSCRFFDNGYALTVEYRRELQYVIGNDRKLDTWANSKEWCDKLNRDGESGWTLATIPTEYHNTLVMNMITKEWPGVKKDDKFNLLWIGLEDVEKKSAYTWMDETPVNYVRLESWKVVGKYGLINKNTGQAVMKNSNTFMARSLCSRAINCWNIDTAVENGEVTFSDGSLVEGTVADVTCDDGYSLVGEGLLTCAAGRWDADLPTCVQDGDKKDGDENNGDEKDEDEKDGDEKDGDEKNGEENDGDEKGGDEKDGDGNDGDENDGDEQDGDGNDGDEKDGDEEDEDEEDEDGNDEEKEKEEEEISDKEKKKQAKKEKKQRKKEEKQRKKEEKQNGGE